MRQATRHSGFRTLRRWSCACVLFGTVLGLRVPAQAQEMHLEDAIRSALDNSIAIKRQDSKIIGAAGLLKEAAGAFDWSVESADGWQKLFVPLGVNGFLSSQTRTASVWVTSINAGRTFRNGLEIRPGVTLYPASGLTTAQTFGLTHIRPVLGFKIPLLRGLGEENADAPELAARDALKGTHLQRSFVAEQVVATTVETFWRCLAVEQHKKIFIESDHDAADYEAWMNLMAKRGLLEPSVAQATAGKAATRHLNLTKADDDVQLCRRDLGLAVRGVADDPLPVPAGDLPEIDGMGPSVDGLDEAALVSLALDRRDDFKALQRLVDAEHDKLRGAQNGLLPRLDIQLDPYQATLTYTQSLENTSAEGLVSATAAAENEARLNMQQLQNDIRSQVGDALRDLRRARSAWVVLTDSDRQLESVVADMKKRVAFGTTDRGQYADTLDQLAEIRHSLVDAKLQFASSLAELRLATGSVDLEAASPEAIVASFHTLPSP